MKLIRKHANKIALMLGLSLLFVSCSQYETYDITDEASIGKNVNISEVSQRVASISGVDLYKSIFFGIGTLANNINQLKNKVDLTNGLSPKKRTEVLTKLEILLTSINKKHPLFFNDFKQKIASGDQQQIKLAIDQGGYLLHENIEVIFPQFKKVFNKIKSDINTGKLKFDENDNLQTYVDTFQKEFDNGEYDNLLNENMISSEEAGLVPPCSWAIVCVLYFVGGVHNTIAATALIYFKAAFWGPSIDSAKEIIGSNKPTNETEDSLKTETLINEIAEYYAVN